MNKIKSFVKDVIYFLSMMKYLIRNSSFFSSLSLHPTDSSKNEVYLLCNGPSLKDVLPTLYTMVGQDFIVVNFLGNDPIFSVIQPKYYTLMDGLFFYNRPDNRHMEKLVTLYNNFNTIVTWPMTVYIPIHYKKKFMKFSKLNNPNIKVVGLNTIAIDKASKSLRHCMYRKGWSMPNAQTVAIESIFAMINKGYKRIYLYGVDHTFLDGLKVTEENQLVHVYQHFYEKEPKVIPVVDAFNVAPTMSSELQTIVNIFRSHELCRLYADDVGCRIINLTNGSQIDSYERGK
ncbi:hypothetical protein [Bacteroides xylanisolvens]|nr:hypothetical protein [Bacteroides xylanisolvens]